MTIQARYGHLTASGAIFLVSKTNAKITQITGTLKGIPKYNILHTRERGEGTRPVIININMEGAKSVNMEGTRPIVMNKEGTPPLRGVPYPTF